MCSSQHGESRKVSAPLRSSIQNPTDEEAEQVHVSQKQLKAEVHQTVKTTTSLANEIKAGFPQSRRAAIEQSCEDGASSWLTVIPITDFGFNLHKQAFWELCVCVMVDLSATFPLTVPMAYPSALITHLHVRRVLSPQSGTRSETYWQTSSLKCVHALQLSLHYCPLVVNNFNFVQPT